MASRMTLVVAVLALVGATVATAQATEVVGRIDRIELEQRVVTLSDGRMYRLTPDTIVSVNSQPVTLSTLVPGQTVVIRSGQAVALQNGQYIVVGPGQTVTPAAPDAPSVVIAPPATVTPAGVRQTVYAKIKDVDEDGTVKIDTGRDSFEMKMSRDLVRQIREGDTVQLEMTVVPAGSPAASPATR